MKKYTIGLCIMLIVCLSIACEKVDTGRNQGSSPAPAPTPTPTTTNLAITDFSPKSGKPESDITITGTRFGNTLADVRVAVGNLYYYEPVSVTPTTIVFKTNLVSRSGKITVFVKGSTVISAADYTALPDDPKIVGFDTSNGQLGHQMYLYANGLNQLSDADTSKIFISFGDTTAVKANYLGPSRFATGAIVPRYAQAGKITLTINGKSDTSVIDFPLHVSMRYFTPAIAARGDTLKITGVAFTSITDIGVLFNSPYGPFVRPVRVTPTEMWVVVPNAAQTGYLQVSTAYGTVTDTYYDQKFQVR